MATAKLTDEQVKEIRDRYAARGATQQALADRYGVTRVHISRIISGASRFSVEQYPNGPERRTNFKLTSKQIDNIRKAYAAGGVTQQQLADRYGVSRVHVARILCGMSRVNF